MTAMPWSMSAAMGPARSFGSRSGDPDHPAPPAAVSEDLQRRVVVGGPTADRRPHQPARHVVDIHDQLPDDQPVAERDDAGAVLEARVDHEPRGQPRVHRAHVANRVPGLLGPSFHDNLSPYRRHGSLRPGMDGAMEVRPR